MAASRRARIHWRGYLFILPAFIVFGVFLGFPLVQTAQYSFYDWDGLGPSTWAGLSNYVTVFTDPAILDSFAHTGVLIAFYALFPIALALLLTSVISRANRLPGMSFFRTVLFLPQVIASVVVATTWITLYAPDGLINQILRAIGLDSLARVWLGDFSAALFAIGFVGTWLNLGLCLVLFLSGIANIAPETFEAARLDGASARQEFFGITIRALRGQVAVALTLTITTALKTFDLVFVTTRGGPGNTTSVPALEAYNRAFNTGQVGSGASIAVVLTVAIVLISVLISRLQPKDVA